MNTMDENISAQENEQEAKKPIGRNILNFIVNKKKIIILTAIIIITVIFIILLCKLLLLPLYNYNMANEYMTNKDYVKAIELYEKNKEFQDSNDKIKTAYYEYGISLVDEGKYEDAINMFEKGIGDSLEKYIAYANAMIDFNNGKYNTALSAFKNLTEFKQSNDYINYCNLMLAEEQFKEGNLTAAKRMFSEMDNNLEFNDIKVSSRLEKLDKYKDFVDLCGTWSGTDGKFSVTQTHDSTGLWDSWDSEYDGQLKLKCIINQDDTVTLKGDAKYYIYTNYSSLSKYLKAPQKSLTIDKTVNAIPSEIASDTNVQLTYSGGKFSLVYDYEDANSSMNFTYRYKSSISYNTRTEE